MDAGCFFAIFLILICVVTALFSFMAQIRATNEDWAKFALTAGLSFIPGNIFSMPKLAGKYKGFNYTLETITRSEGESSSTYTVIAISLPSTACNLHIYKKNFFTKIEKTFGAHDIQIGDRKFDESFMIKSTTPSRVDKLFSPEVRRKLLYRSELINMKLSYDRLINESPGVIRDMSLLTYLSDVMCELAENACKVKELASGGNMLDDRAYGKSSETVNSLPSGHPHDGFTDSLSSTPAYESDFIDTVSRFKSCPSCGANISVTEVSCIHCDRDAKK